MLVSESPGSGVCPNPTDIQCPQASESRHPRPKKERAPFGNGTIIFQEHGKKSREVR